MAERPSPQRAGGDTRVILDTSPSPTPTSNSQFDPLTQLWTCVPLTTPTFCWLWGLTIFLPRHYSSLPSPLLPSPASPVTGNKVQILKLTLRPFLSSARLPQAARSPLRTSACLCPSRPHPAPTGAEPLPALFPCLGVYSQTCLPGPRPPLSSPGPLPSGGGWKRSSVRWQSALSAWLVLHPVLQPHPGCRAKPVARACDQDASDTLPAPCHSSDSPLSHPVHLMP